MRSAEERLDIVQGELLAALSDLVEHAREKLWLTDTDTVFERLAYLFETAGGDRDELLARWPECFD